MSWASRRRLTILLIVGAVVAAFLAIVLIATLYKTPSCSDGVQNQDEAGVDCGGSCAYLCTAQAQPPVVLFTKVLSNGAGRTDAIAMVENKNVNAAAKSVPYRITLYGADRVFVKEVAGMLDLPPGASVPVYVAGIASGQQRVASAFLEVAASAPQWFMLRAGSYIVPTVVRTTGGGTPDAPRVEAVLANPSAAALSNVRVIVLVRDARKEVVAASETMVPTLPAQGQATALFTWNSGFVGVPTLIEAFPIIPFP